MEGKGGRVIIGRILAVVFVVGLITFFVIFVVGMYNECSCGSRDEEWGNFTVSFYDDRTVAYITGLSELGQQQKNIVIPKEIDGANVVALGEKTFVWEPKVKKWYSDKLEKIYVTRFMKILDGTFDNCPNLKKAISVYGGSGIDVPYFTEVYFANEVYLSVHPSQIDDWGRANVSYFFNYDNEENYGYYWVDDYDYGSRIEYIPEDPTREGYTFGGWYKEGECINKWDFDSDTLPEESTEISEDGKEEVVYQETKLYAKWVG